MSTGDSENLSLWKSQFASMARRQGGSILLVRAVNNFRSVQLSTDFIEWGIYGRTLQLQGKHGWSYQEARQNAIETFAADRVRLMPYVESVDRVAWLAERMDAFEVQHELIGSQSGSDRPYTRPQAQGVSLMPRTSREAYLARRSASPAKRRPNLPRAQKNER